MAGMVKGKAILIMSMGIASVPIAITKVSHNNHVYESREKSN
jgi:hypothetical protein